MCLRALLSPFCCIGHPAVSIGGPGYLAQEEEALSTLYTQHDILAIASAGNTGNETLSYPASYQNVISVAAVNANKVRAGFSTHNPFVDLSAPGVGVWSLLPMNSDCEICAFASYSGYISLQGTSMACPFVAGVAALLKSYDPAKANARSIHNALLESAEDLGATGRDDFYGEGLVAAHDALNHLKMSLGATPSQEECSAALSTLQTCFASCSELADRFIAAPSGH